MRDPQIVIRVPGEPTRLPSVRENPIRGLGFDRDQVVLLRKRSISRLAGTKEELVFSVTSGDLQHLCVGQGRLFVWHRDAQDKRLLSMRSDGSETVSLAQEPEESIALGKLCVGSASLFWTCLIRGDLDDVTCLMRTAVSGSRTEMLASADGARRRRTAFPVYADEVYWAFTGGGQRHIQMSEVVDAGLRPIKEHMLAGSSPAIAHFCSRDVEPQIIPMRSEIEVLTTDGRSLFHDGSEPTADGSRVVLQRTPVDGGEPTRLTDEDAFAAQQMVVVGNDLIWTRNRTSNGEGEQPAVLLRTPAKGGPTEILSRAVGTIAHLTSSRREILWVDVETGDTMMDVRSATVCRLPLH